MIIIKNTSLLGLATLVVIASAHPRAHSGAGHGHHRQETQATECVTLNMPPNAMAKMLSGTGGGAPDTDLAEALQDLKAGQQQVKTVLLQELQAKVLEDLERSEIVLQLQEAQKKQTHMLQKMQLLLENIVEHGVQKPKPFVNSNEVVVHQTTLSNKIQNDAINAAKEAVEKYSEYEDICPHIMSAMEEHHNKYWECTVGRDYAAWVMANSGQFLKFSIGDLTFRIFRVLP